MTTEVVEIKEGIEYQVEQEMEYGMSEEQMKQNAEDPRYQIYLKLLPNNLVERCKYLILSTPVEDLEDKFQEILNNMYFGEDFYDYESSDYESEGYDDMPTAEDMSDFECYLEEKKLRDELEDLEKMIEIKHTNYTNNVMSIKDARVLAEEYNNLEISEVEIDGKLTRKTKYIINYNTIVTISKYVRKEKITLKYLVEFLEKYHIYNILDSTLFLIN